MFVKLFQNDSELFGRTIRVNLAKPMKMKEGASRAGVKTVKTDSFVKLKFILFNNTSREYSLLIITFSMSNVVTIVLEETLPILLYASSICTFSTDMKAHTTAFDAPVMEDWLG